MTCKPVHRSAHIAGCNEETIYEHSHYYDCRPHQHDRYTFTVSGTGDTTTQEAMHALMPVFELLPWLRGKDDALWCLEETIHALLHGDAVTARNLGRAIGLKIQAV